MNGRRSRDGVREGEEGARVMEIERPQFVKERHLLFLDDLRESGVTNMYGASPYLQEEYGMSRDRAVATLSYWMKTFAQRQAATSE